MTEHGKVKLVLQFKVYGAHNAEGDVYAELIKVLQIEISAY